MGFVIRNPSCHWPHGWIPFRIAPTQSLEIRDVIA